MIINILPALLCATLATATLEVRTGLLDRLVQHFKGKFFGDLVDVAPVQVNVSIQRAPPGYVDSSAWDYDSVIHLIGLIRESEANLPKPVRRALQEFLTPEPVPSRRYGGMGNMHKARQRAAAKMRKCLGDPNRPGYPKYCPRDLRRSRSVELLGARYNSINSINRQYIPSFPNPNYLYYDEMIPVEQPPDPKTSGPTKKPRRYKPSMNDDDLVVISNPVEARLPSGLITIGTLRRILEARAEAARVMPTRLTTTMLIASTNKTAGAKDNSTDTGATGATDAGTGAADDAATAAEGAADGAAEAEAGADTPAEAKAGADTPAEAKVGADTPAEAKAGADTPAEAAPES